MKLNEIPNGNSTARTVSTRIARELDEAANDLAPLLVAHYLARADICRTLKMSIDLMMATRDSAQAQRHYMVKEVQDKVAIALQRKSWYVEFRKDQTVNLTPELPLSDR